MIADQLEYNLLITITSILDSTCTSRDLLRLCLQKDIPVHLCVKGNRILKAPKGTVRCSGRGTYNPDGKLIYYYYALNKTKEETLITEEIKKDIDFGIVPNEALEVLFTREEFYINKLASSNDYDLFLLDVAKINLNNLYIHKRNITSLKLPKTSQEESKKIQEEKLIMLAIPYYDKRVAKHHFIPLVVKELNETLEPHLNPMTESVASKIITIAKIKSFKKAISIYKESLSD